MKAICIKEPGQVVIQEMEMPVRKPGEALAQTPVWRNLRQ